MSETAQLSREAACVACGSASWGERVVAREWMFGSGTPFEYVECTSCGCVQLASPSDPSAHYPADYYAFGADSRGTNGTVRARLRRLRNAGVFAGHPIGEMLARVQPYPVAGANQWFARTGTTREARILDIGCGSGALLGDLADAGFRSLLGVDPYVSGDLTIAPGVEVRRASVHEIDGEFDLVMLHHALEHADDQLGTLSAAARLLAPGGWCLVRVPIVSSWAWRHYREHWVQLDAPRHVALHTETSLRVLGARAGLALQHVDHDSTAFQFAGSELSKHGRRVDGDWPTHFTRRELRDFRRRADSLNAQSAGDQAAFYFRRAGDDAGPSAV